jgi:cyclopropane fatty-acyl-phospholipid synthase-like methyltransferase
MNAQPVPEKPHAPSCERNRDVILDVLKTCFADCRHVLEVGSGTGQHAVYFAAALPHLVWQATDRAENLPGIQAWLDEAALVNTPPARGLDVTGPWPTGTFDGVFSANTLHIMAWPEVEAFFAALPAVMAPAFTLAIYGPFNYDGRFTSESNAAFDDWLKARGAHQGIRDFEAVDALARSAGLALAEDRAMPANNRCLVWRRAVAFPHG